ncbi:MAG TPA: hypothetical protein VHA15_05730 [Burkholderiales bacterium]|nr:hypothetical protein [Burkholderiales bacterium]
MDQYIRGQKVLVQTANRGRVELLVWEEAGESVYLCSEQQFDALSKGWDAPQPIAFPKSDIAAV